jgi:hypothetical protein
VCTSEGLPAGRLGRALAAGALALLVSAPAGAQQLRDPGVGRKVGAIGFQMTVSHVSPNPGPIDPRGAALHRRLKDEIRYESLRVLEQRRLDLAMDEIGTLQLPTGRRLRVRPLDVGKQGVLVAVDLEGSMKTDLRVPNHKLVVIGGQPYEGGRLVITLEPEY